MSDKFFLRRFKRFKSVGTDSVNIIEEVCDFILVWREGKSTELFPYSMWCAPATISADSKLDRPVFFQDSKINMRCEKLLILFDDKIIYYRNK